MFIHSGLRLSPVSGPLRRGATLGAAAGLGLLAAACVGGDDVGGSEPCAPTTVSVSPNTTTLRAIGHEAHLAATASASDGSKCTGVTFTWFANPTSVCTVSGSGLVTAVDNGSCTVTASTPDDMAGAANVVVDQEAVGLVFHVQPVGADAGQPLATQPNLCLLDAGGVDVRDDNATSLGLEIGDDPSAGTAHLSGSTSRTVSAGCTTFSNLAIDVEGTGYTLFASAAALPEVESAPFSIGAVVASVSVSPATALLTAKGETVQLTAQAVSTSGRPVPDISFRWDATPPSVCSVDATGDVTADDNGTCAVTATASSATPSVSGGATVNVEQRPSQLRFGSQPQGGKAEAVLPAFEACIDDANGHAVTIDHGSTLQVEIGANPSGGALSGTTTRTVAAGCVQFNDLRIDLEGNGYTLTLSSTLSLPPRVSGPFDVERHVTSVAVSCSVSRLESLGATGQCSAEARTPSGRVIPGVTFMWSAAPASACQIDNTGLVTAVANGTCTVRAEADEVTGSEALLVEQRAAQITIGPPDFAALELAETRSFAIRVWDALGNAVPSPTITSSCLESRLASATGTSITGMAEGVTDCFFTSGTVADTARVAIVAQKGFAAILTTDGGTYRVGAPGGATLVLHLRLIRPTSGDGDLGSIQGALTWNAAVLSYVGSAVEQAGWSWFPNELDAASGSLGFAAFSATGTATDFALARVTFAVSGVSGAVSDIGLTVAAAGNGLGGNVTALIEPVNSRARIP